MFNVACRLKLSSIQVSVHANKHISEQSNARSQYSNHKLP